ncbi:MAG: hypothetical protein LC781_07610, partial [Actinobacteria bacterium]|nr:hypothetical protein [Actinomycetota bacterium]
TQAAEYGPEKIQTLVYLAAYLPLDGETFMDLSGSDPEVRANGIVDEEEGWMWFGEDAAREAFGADVPDDVWDAYWSRTRPEPLAPLVTPVLTTGERFGRVSRVYVEALRDRGLSPALQGWMHSALPCQVLSMDTGHMPMLSAPGLLADLLLSLASPEDAGLDPGETALVARANGKRAGAEKGYGQISLWRRVRRVAREIFS